MTETKFTPGRWTADFGEAIKVRAEDGSQLCIMAHLTKRGRRDGDEVGANAHLIAAAPALYGQHESNLVDLDFLRQAIEAGDPKRELLVRVSDIVRRTNAALSQARGEK